MKITREQVEHIAKLARIHLEDDEKEKFATQLSAVLEYMNILNEVDTTHVEPTSQVTGLKDVFREDVVVPCNDATLALIVENFPDKVGNFLKVPPVFE